MKFRGGYWKKMVCLLFLMNNVCLKVVQVTIKNQKDTLIMYKHILKKSFLCHHHWCHLVCRSRKWIVLPPFPPGSQVSEVTGQTGSLSAQLRKPMKLKPQQWCIWLISLEDWRYLWNLLWLRLLVYFIFLLHNTVAPRVLVHHTGVWVADLSAHVSFYFPQRV